MEGIRLTGKADRIDRLKDGSLAVVDYKTGAAPSGSAAFDGLDNQLGLLGLLAEMGKVEGVSAGSINSLEYWSLKADRAKGRSEEHTSELQSLMRISYAVFCLKKKNEQHDRTEEHNTKNH